MAELESILRLEGFVVSTALSGEDGLQKLQNLPAKLVISDQKMAGGMSGTEFLTQVKKQSPEVLTMILSAFSEPEYLMESVNSANVYQYLLKPWNQDDLIHRVSQALQFYHEQAERLRLAEANKRLLKKMSLMENFSLIGEFSSLLYERLFPVLRNSLRVDGCAAGVASSLGVERMIDCSEWSHIGTVVSRLGQVGLFYHLPPGFQLANVVAEVDECIDEARKAAGKFNIDWQFDFELALPNFLLQKETFSCAIKALIENAVIHNQPELDCHSPRKVAIKIFSMQQPELTLCIEIEDDGPGCLEGEKIFLPLNTSCVQQSAPWVRVNDLADYNFDAYSHVGLGLAIARWCITQHDGTLDLQNPGDKGARFRIEIPFQQKDLRQQMGQ